MITIENTSYGYKSNPLIFNNISLEIGNGIYGLLGENGVGKTTLMHLICGLLFPKNGKCSIDGRNTAERQSEGLARYFFLPEIWRTFPPQVLFPSRFRNCDDRILGTINHPHLSLTNRPRAWPMRTLQREHTCRSIFE